MPVYHLTADWSGPIEVQADDILQTHGSWDIEIAHIDYIEDGARLLLPRIVPMRIEAAATIRARSCGRDQELHIIRGFWRSGILPGAPVVTSATITGASQIGSVLTAVVVATGTPPPAITVQWRSGGVAISDATAATYDTATRVAGEVIDYTYVVSNGVAPDAAGVSSNQITMAAPSEMALTEDAIIVNAEGTVLAPAEYAGRALIPDNGDDLALALSPTIAGYARIGETIDATRGVWWHDTDVGVLDRELRLRVGGVQHSILPDANTNTVQYVVPADGDIDIIDAIRQEGGAWLTSQSNTLPATHLPPVIGKDYFEAIEITNLNAWLGASGIAYTQLVGTAANTRVLTTEMEGRTGTSVVVRGNSGPDQFAEIRVRLLDPAGWANNYSYLSAGVRLSAEGASYAGYEFHFHPNGSFYLRRRIGGVTTNLAIIPNTDYGFSVAGDEVTLIISAEAVGGEAVVKAWINGELIVEHNDVSPISGGECGIVNSSNPSTIMRGVYFDGGNL